MFIKNHHAKRNRGAAIITSVLFFVVISVVFALGLSSSVVREYITSRDFDKSKGSYYLSEGVHEDALYRIKTGKNIGTTDTITLNGNTAIATIVTNGGSKDISSTGSINNNFRKVKSTLSTSSGVAFNYGVQAGDGGVLMTDTSVINGNLFSNGPVSGSGNLITGTVVSASSTIGSITKINSNGSMYAPIITNSTIGGTPYCNTISGSTPNTCTALPAQTPGTLPITQAQITQWESDALAGGTIVCTGNTYTVNGTVTLGPVKIVGPSNSVCDLTINANGIVTLGGTVWVTGNIDIKTSSSGNAEVDVSSALPGLSIAMIADNPADHLNSSTVNIENNAKFVGSGAGSYVMLLGQNNGASLTPPQYTDAVEVQDKVQGTLLVYAGLGDILIKGQAQLNSVTGYKITLSNTAVITYSTGLANTLFTSGPGGGWVISDWKETQ